MSHRYKRKGLRINEGLFLLFVLIFGALLIPILISIMTPKEPVEREIYIEGVITEKNIEKGFGSAYIFVLNGTTDLQVNRWQYDYFSVGDYIIVYLVFLGYELERR